MPRCRPGAKFSMPPPKLSIPRKIKQYRVKFTSGYATWFTAGGAIRIAHYDVIGDVITRKLQEIEKNGDDLAP